MTGVYKFVSNAIHTYPSLFRCRTDVLNYHLTIGGTGAIWVNGELVYVYDDKPSEIFTDEYKEISDYRKMPSFSSDDPILKNPILKKYEDDRIRRKRLEIRKTNLELAFHSRECERFGSHGS